jgi:hypothetical protein
MYLSHWIPRDIGLYFIFLNKCQTIERNSVRVQFLTDKYLFFVIQFIVSDYTIAILLYSNFSEYIILGTVLQQESLLVLFV